MSTITTKFLFLQHVVCASLKFFQSYFFTWHDLWDDIMYLDLVYSTFFTVCVDDSYMHELKYFILVQKIIVVSKTFYKAHSSTQMWWMAFIETYPFHLRSELVKPKKSIMAMVIWHYLEVTLFCYLIFILLMFMSNMHCVVTYLTNIIIHYFLLLIIFFSFTQTHHSSIFVQDNVEVDVVIVNYRMWWKVNFTLSFNIFL